VLLYMAKSHRLTHSFFLRYLVGTTLSILVIGLFWLFSSYQQLNREKQILNDQAVQKQMEQMKSRVNSVIEMIHIERRLNAEKTKREIQSRVYNAHALMTNIYHQYKDQLPQEEIADIIRNALRKLSYGNGRGYFFITGLDGTEHLYPPVPTLEGTSFLKLVDINGQPIVRDMIALIKKDGEGFYHYNWPDPQHPDTPQAKTAFVKYFAPFDWLVGTGDRITDITKDLQDQLIQRIEKITFENGGYVFVANYQGIGLSYPAQGKNMYEVADSNGLKIVQELISLAKNDGGYLNYVMPALKGERPEDKISYVKGINDWQWYVGTGDFVVDLDQELTAMFAEREKSTKIEIATILSFLIFFLLIGYYSSRRLGKQVQSGFNEFQTFFDRAARKAQPIDSETQPFSEFKNLAHSANLMIQERNYYEHEANEYREQLSSVIDSMPSILLTVDNQGMISQWNKYAILETGIDESKALGQHVSLILPYLHRYLREILTTSCEEKEIFNANIDLVRAGGNRIKNVSAYPLGNTDLQRIVIRIDDITDRVNMEEMMMQTEKMMSIGGLAAGMAHEINNPLSIISQAAQNTIRRTSPDFSNNLKVAEEAGIDLHKMSIYFDKRGVNGFLKNICTGVERSSDIIKNMLDFSSNNASHREICSLKTIVKDSITLVRNDYDLKKKKDFRDIKIDVDINESLPNISINKIEIQQVIFNLLKNAGQAMFDIKTDGYHPVIQIQASANEQFLTLTVNDNGPGIPQHIQSRIFEPFFTTKEVGVGTGLGLSVSYYIIVKRHHGNFQIDSELGRGTLFTIDLPRDNTC
jgi:two-component system, NtrC family, sensor kinase